MDELSHECNLSFHLHRFWGYGWISLNRWTQIAFFIHLTNFDMNCPFKLHSYNLRHTQAMPRHLYRVLSYNRKVSYHSAEECKATQKVCYRVCNMAMLLHFRWQRTWKWLHNDFVLHPRSFVPNEIENASVTLLACWEATLLGSIVPRGLQL